jgi:hypothetical protein
MHHTGSEPPVYIKFSIFVIRFPKRRRPQCHKSLANPPVYLQIPQSALEKSHRAGSLCTEAEFMNVQFL